MRRKKRENFTRRRCWWSKRRNEKGVRDSETRRERERWPQRKEGFSRGNIHMRDRERKRESTRPAFY